MQQYGWHWDSAKMKSGSHLGIITALLHLYEVHSNSKNCQRGKKLNYVTCRCLILELG